MKQQVNPAVAAIIAVIVIAVVAFFMTRGPSAQEVKESSKRGEEVGKKMMETMNQRGMGNGTAPSGTR